MTESDGLTINPRTGLREGWNDYFGVPEVHQLRLDDVQFGESEAAIHNVPIARGRSIDFYANLAPADELYVSLHGAIPVGKLRYPTFWRIKSLTELAPSFLAFADPTLQLSDKAEFGLGWYIGGTGWDPLDQIGELVRQAMEHTGATRVMFLGGSGGGFAALRIATRFPGSIAFVQDPQTAVAAYHIGHQKRLVEAGWPGQPLPKVLAQYPERFDLLHLYRQTDPANYIYYRQSAIDTHVEKHYEPFMAAVADTMGMREGRFRFILEYGETPGHGKITNAEFAQHFHEAVRWWRSKAGTPSSSVSGPS